tara:strand:+ start:1482 stop:1865 length:384 start_codon:yes stop_codon:yes gene_type:complete
VSNEQPATSVSKAKSSQTSSSAKSIEIAKAFEAGQAISSLAQQLKVKPSTVIHHLYCYVQEGHKLSPAGQILEQSQLSDTQLAKVLAAFTEHGTQRLKPVYDGLKEQISYDQLHLLRIYYLNTKAKN